MGGTIGAGGAAKKLIAFRQIATVVAAGKQRRAEPVDPMLGGLAVEAWFEVFWDTHYGNGMGSVVRAEWPEPGGYVAQAAVTVTALRMVTEAVLEEAKNEQVRHGQ